MRRNSDMQQIEISELPKNIELLLDVIKNQEELLLTKEAVPIAKVVSLTSEKIKKRRQAGSAAGQIWIAPDFDEPL